MSRLLRGALLSATAILAASSAPALAVVYTVTFEGDLADNFVRTDGVISATSAGGTFSAVFTFDTDDLPAPTPLSGESFRYELTGGWFASSVTIENGLSPAFAGAPTVNRLNGTFGSDGGLELEDSRLGRDDAGGFESAVLSISGFGGLGRVPGTDFPDFSTAQGLYFSLSSTVIDNVSGTDRFTYAGGDVDRVRVAAVPEPATWATMALGFGLLGAAARRRRAAARA